ncbi:MAG TPA: hypothetical protein VFY28_01115 [Candidatus Paceibacterota bacterium]|nr:hypothetical protein [Candidatus Paceibacterota bacterium]
MCNSSSFEAVVSSDLSGGIQRTGTEVRVIAWLSSRAAEIPTELYEKLQREHDGELEIVHERGRILIEQTVVVCSTNGLRRAKLKLASKIGSSLGIQATIQ